MAGYSDDQLERETIVDIRWRTRQGHPCSCENRDDKWYLCTYHEGYDDALSAIPAPMPESREPAA